MRGSASYVIILLGSFLSKDGIADIVADRYRGRQTNSQVIVLGVPSRREKKIATPDRRLHVDLFSTLFETVTNTATSALQNLQR